MAIDSSRSVSLLADVVSAWPAIAAADLVRYLVPVSLLASLPWLASRRWRLRRAVRTREPSPRQRRRELAWSLSTVLVFSLVGAAILAGHRAGMLLVYVDPFERGLPWLVASFALVVLLHDTWFYWVHRAMHHPRAFRWTHRVHHRSVAPTPWAAYAFSPAEALAQAAFLPLVLLAVPMHVAVIFAFTLHMVVRNAIGHCGVELLPRAWLAGTWGRWLTTTLHHDLHHAHGDGNYGLYFTFWDRRMGTERPEYRARLAALAARAGDAVTGPAIAIGLAAIVSAWPSNAAAADIAGTWFTQGASARIEIGPCRRDADAWCGTIVGLWEPNDADGRPMRDQRHPDPARRNRPLVGVALLEGFRPSGRPGVWGGGRIYNPEDGRTYAATLTLGPDGVLEVEGCVLVFCARQVWRRPASVCGA